MPIGNTQAVPVQQHRTPDGSTGIGGAGPPPPSGLSLARRPCLPRDLDPGGYTMHIGVMPGALRRTWQARWGGLATGKTAREKTRRPEMDIWHSTASPSETLPWRFPGPFRRRRGRPYHPEGDASPDAEECHGSVTAVASVSGGSAGGIRLLTVGSAA